MTADARDACRRRGFELADAIRLRDLGDASSKKRHWWDYDIDDGGEDVESRRQTVDYGDENVHRMTTE